MKNLICIFIVLINTLYHINAEEKPIVSCKLCGQLGNQLLQIATTLAYAWDYDAIPIFPSLNQNEHLLSYNRDRIFFRLDASSNTRPWLHTFKEKDPYGYQKIPFKPDQLLVGFFVSRHYFHHHRDNLLKVFAPSSSTQVYLYQKYKHLIDHPKTVAVNVRTYKLTYHQSGNFPFIGLDYYERAMNIFPSDYLFVIFSDRIKWCEKHFRDRFKNRQMVFIDDNDHIQDLFLASLMKNHITANSSFSWWCAYLNQNPHKIVVAPTHWKVKKSIAPSEPNILYLDDWILVTPNWNEPYPADMKLYDKHSKSIDSQ